MWLPLHSIKKFTKLMTRSLVQDMVTFLNRLPSKNGISRDLRPSVIILGSPNPDYSKLKSHLGHIHRPTYAPPSSPIREQWEKLHCDQKTNGVDIISCC